jgi:hypothetical protein
MVRPTQKTGASMHTVQVDTTWYKGTIVPVGFTIYSTCTGVQRTPSNYWYMTHSIIPLVQVLIVVRYEHTVFVIQTQLFHKAI